jgi:hypothetical protein
MMDIFPTERDGVTSLGVVFFANDLIRALDTYREAGRRPPGLGALCDKAIVALHALHRPDSPAAVDLAAGLLSSIEELATVISSLRRKFNPQSSAEAAKVVERIQGSLNRIKDQKAFSEELRERINEVLEFFQSVAEEGLANSQRQASGETTEAERVWSHYSTI